MGGFISGQELGGFISGHPVVQAIYFCNDFFQCILVTLAKNLAVFKQHLFFVYVSAVSAVKMNYTQGLWEARSYPHKDFGASGI